MVRRSLAWKFLGPVVVFDQEIQAWRNRPIGAFSVMVVDAIYEKVRLDHAVVDQALLIAYGVDPFGKRHVLDVFMSQSEAEVHWRHFFQSLIEAWSLWGFS